MNAIAHVRWSVGTQVHPAVSFDVAAPTTTTTMKVKLIVEGFV